MALDSSSLYSRPWSTTPGRGSGMASLASTGANAAIGAATGGIGGVVGSFAPEIVQGLMSIVGYKLSGNDENDRLIRQINEKRRNQAIDVQGQQSNLQWQSDLAQAKSRRSRQNFLTAMGMAMGQQRPAWLQQTAIPKAPSAASIMSGANLAQKA